jgi:hypothetical protein
VQAEAQDGELDGGIASSLAGSDSAAGDIAMCVTGHVVDDSTK